MYHCQFGWTTSKAIWTLGYLGNDADARSWLQMGCVSPAASLVNGRCRRCGALSTGPLVHLPGPVEQGFFLVCRGEFGRSDTKSISMPVFYSSCSSWRGRKGAKRKNKEICHLLGRLICFWSVHITRRTISSSFVCGTISFLPPSALRIILASHLSSQQRPSIRTILGAFLSFPPFLAVFFSRRYQRFFGWKSTGAVAQPPPQATIIKQSAQTNNIF